MVLATENFYDALAEDYHLLFADWERSIAGQARIIDDLLQARRPGRGSLLDCACGIGTQALGLAGLGWLVRATDISQDCVMRAAREAASRGLAITTSSVDMRRLRTDVRGTFDAVICCDNSVAHLLTEEDLLATLGGMRERLKPEGVLLLTLRDYDAIRAARPSFAGQRLHLGPQGKRIVFQVWEWSADGRTYLGNHFILRERAGGWGVEHRTTWFRAFLREEIEAALRAAGLLDLRWHMPEETGYHQPVVTALRPRGGEPGAEGGAS
jgi:SAM-dependent methyltransferase